jgi:hypothetical protein
MPKSVQRAPLENQTRAVLKSEMSRNRTRFRSNENAHALKLTVPSSASPFDSGQMWHFLCKRRRLSEARRRAGIPGRNSRLVLALFPVMTHY